MPKIYTVSFVSYDELSTELYGEVCAVFDNYGMANTFAISEVADTLSYYDEGVAQLEDSIPNEWVITVDIEVLCNKIMENNERINIETCN